MALKTRALSAAVMIPPVLGAVWYGGWAFAGLVGLAAGLMVWEWFRMTSAGRFTRQDLGIAVAMALACLLVQVSAAAGFALMAVAALAAARLSSRAWIGWGAVYAGLPSVVLVWLRGDNDAGRQVLLALLLVVWAIDIMAYAFGRSIGGPLLAPSISPKKTWAGLVGGMVGASLVGAGLSSYYHFAELWLVVPFCAVLAVIEQAGDFLESWVKRRWGVKDSSGLIPGHGGVMDRVDGLLAAGLVVAVGKLIADWI